MKLLKDKLLSALRFIESDECADINDSHPYTPTVLMSENLRMTSKIIANNNKTIVNSYET